MLVHVAFETIADIEAHLQQLAHKGTKAAPALFRWNLECVGLGRCWDFLLVLGLTDDGDGGRGGGGARELSLACSKLTVSPTEKQQCPSLADRSTYLLQVTLFHLLEYRSDR
jgi:hypothetical protein